MVFSSLFFICLFLPLNLLLYFLMPSLKAKNIVMLVFSLIFYAWGEPVYILLLVGMAVIDWLLALFIGKQNPHSCLAKLGIVTMCVINLGLLGFFKYLNFIIENLRLFTDIPNTTFTVILPIGISFYTFQLMSYVIDVYRNDVEPQKNFAKLLLYVSLFHQCIAGPIVRYRDVAAELEERRATAADVTEGVWRFCIGLFKKSLLANTCGALADSLFASTSLGDSTVIAVWCGVFAFSLQIYLDFSAYSDMAIGMGRMIGIHYRENFDYPYISRSVTEFWRRWHISLGTFFRDYLYIPLGGNRKGKIRTVFNLFIVWALTGLWHGASWNFVLWGLYFFVFLNLEKHLLSRFLAKQRVFSHIYLLVILFFGWLLFYFEDTVLLFTALKGMFGLNGNAFCNFETGTIIGSYALMLILSVIACTPLMKRLGIAVQSLAMNSRTALCFYGVGRVLIPIVLLALAIVTLAGDSYNPFLYFQF